jgi:hypothetical protein
VFNIAYRDKVVGVFCAFHCAYIDYALFFLRYFHFRRKLIDLQRMLWKCMDISEGRPILSISRNEFAKAGEKKLKFWVFAMLL